MSRTRKFKKPTDKQLLIACVKAAKKGNREAALETVSGFKSEHSVHKSKKAYSRKKKYTGDWD